MYDYYSWSGTATKPRLPTLESLRLRAGLKNDWTQGRIDTLAWGTFLEVQLYRIGNMGLPLALHPFPDLLPDFRSNEATHPGAGLIAATGASMLCASLVGLIFARHKLLLASWLLSGFCWALPARNFVAFHDFQGIFYIGIPLAFFAFLMLYLRHRSDRRLLHVFAVAALLVFVFSASQIAGVGHTTAEGDLEAELMDDFAAIRELVGEGVVYLPVNDTDREFAGAPFAASYFLADSIIEYREIAFSAKGPRSVTQGRKSAAHFVILPQREFGPMLLTPNNRHRFLYDRELYDNPLGHLTDPVIESDYYDAYLHGDSLIYASESCAHDNVKFFLHITPVDPRDLSDHRKVYGFDNYDFDFPDFAVPASGKCVARRPLPDYPINSIRTGQYATEGRLWEGEYYFD